MKKAMNITCIILNYNDYETTETLLSEIKDYRYLEHILIVDNLSTDNSFEILKKYESDCVHVIRAEYNGGYGYGNNIGIKYAKEKFNSEYCVIANPDVIFEDGIIYELYKFLFENKEYAVVSGYQKGSKKSSAWKETGLLGDIIFNSMILNKIFKPRYYDKNYFNYEICDVYAIPGCFFMARIEALYDIGLYDEEFFLFEEEKVIAYKLKEKGWKSAILGKYSYIHNHSVSIKKSINQAKERKKIVLKSHELYLRKYRTISEKQMKLIYVFYKLAILESMIYEFIRNILNAGEDNEKAKTSDHNSSNI